MITANINYVYNYINPLIHKVLIYIKSKLLKPVKPIQISGHIK